MGQDLAKLLAQFEREIQTAYRGELYLVRDNGAVRRITRPSKRPRPLDEIWTFGSANPSTGYMHVCSDVVHRIVATAFHGDQPSKQHIVDHIDTNRRNNRADNLRWITRLDNVLQNPVTRRRIALAYESIEAFFANPRSPLNPAAVKNYSWMRTVSKAEAEESKRRLQKWAASEKSPSGNGIGEWVYGRPQIDEREPETDFESLSPNVVQRNWKTPTEFELCPDTCAHEALESYCARAKSGQVFASNQYGQSLVELAALGDGFLSVICKATGNPVKPWAVAKVFIEGDKFVHESIGSFFEFDGAVKVHCRLLRLPFEGDTFDDFC